MKTLSENMKARCPEMGGWLDDISLKRQSSWYDAEGKERRRPSFYGLIKIHGITHGLVAWHSIKEDGSLLLSIRRIQQNNTYRNIGYLAETTPEKETDPSFEGEMNFGSKAYRLLGWHKFTKGGNLSIRIRVTFLKGKELVTLDDIFPDDFLISEE